jgi:hypothetical protein
LSGGFPGVLNFEAATAIVADQLVRHHLLLLSISDFVDLEHNICIFATEALFSGRVVAKGRAL